MFMQLNQVDDFEDEISDANLAGYAHPDEIVTDPELSLWQKRRLLSFWASDIHAVEGMPALRGRAFGSTVAVDDILLALRRLDEMSPQIALPSVDGFGVPR